MPQSRLEQIGKLVPTIEGEAVPSQRL